VDPVAALRAVALGTSDLLRPRIWGVVLAGVALTLGLFILLQAGAFWLLRDVAPAEVALPFGWSLPLASALSWGSLALFPLMSIFLMAPVAAGFSGLFSDRVMAAVEAAHYPAHPADPPGLGESILDGLKIMAAVLLVLTLSLALTPVLGPLAPVLFYGANGWLLGREFFQSAARRFLSAEGAAQLRRGNSGTVTLTGVFIALALTVPVVNILVPTLAAATFTHLFQGLRR